MPDLGSSEHFKERKVRFDEQSSADIGKDLLMEQILENINNTPIGQVLKRIACLPEVRREKVLDIRRRINEGTYDLNGQLDEVIERVLEELTI